MQKEILTRAQIKSKFQEFLIGDSQSPQKRGFELERLIYSVLKAEKLKPRASYKPVGEQVDGSFFWKGQTYLLEAKWTTSPVPASSIFSFKGKLDGKFHTTSGIFIAINGYSAEAEEALKSGKGLNIILFDGNDMKVIFNSEASFRKVLKFKLRQAGDTGSLQVPYILKEKAREISAEPTQILKFDDLTNLSIPSRTINDILIFVESKSDIPLIKKLIEPIKSQYTLSYRIEALEGVENLKQIPSLLNIYGDLKETKGLIIILDKDLVEKQNMNSLIQDMTDQLHNSSISVNTKFLFIPQSLRLKLRIEHAIGNLQEETVYKELEQFINQIADEYFDPVTDIPQDALHGSMSHLQWNYEDGVLKGSDEYGMPFEITTLDKLIEYLEDEIGLALNAVMSLEWLHSHDFDHRDEIQEFLLENWAKEIDDLGWDSGNL